MKGVGREGSFPSGYYSVVIVQGAKVRGQLSWMEFNREQGANFPGMRMTGYPLCL